MKNTAIQYQNTASRYRIRNSMHYVKGTVLNHTQFRNPKYPQNNNPK